MRRTVRHVMIADFELLDKDFAWIGAESIPRARISKIVGGCVNCLARI